MLADAGLLTVNATLLFQLLVFALTAYFLWRWAWGPVTAHMAARQQRIDAGLRAADEAERRLASVRAEVTKVIEEAREQARDLIGRAHREAAADAEEIRSKSRREAEVSLERAHGEIAVERDRAMSELRMQVGSMVVSAAGHVLGHAIDEQQHKQLIEESLRKVGAN